MTLRIFLSSVQKELAGERSAVRDWLRSDPLMRRFFEVFLFEEVPAADLRTDHVFLTELAQSAIYVGIFGSNYGFPDAAGISATAPQLPTASEPTKTRPMFI